MVIPRRVLHVDDDPEFTELVAGYLSEHGIETVQLNEPTQAINHLAKFQERVVLLDIEMPRLNGLELLKQIKELDGSIQVVMLTGLVTMSTVLESLRWGPEYCFFKPIVEIEPVIEGLEACFQKIERWWKTLEHLSRRRKADPAFPSVDLIANPSTAKNR